MAAWGYLWAASGGTVDGTGASTLVGREGVASPGGVNVMMLKEIDFDRPSRVANHMAWSADAERLAIGGSLYSA